MSQTHYKVKTPNGLVRKFIITGHGVAEREASEYWFEGCTVELMQDYQSFKPDKIRDVTIQELRNEAA